jgi:hypothetical protein
MAELKPFSFELAKQTNELKKLIAEHPDYPIVVLAGDESNWGDYSWMYCSNISFSLCEILECEAPFETEFVCTDREDFEERFEEWLWDEMCHDDVAGDGVEPSEEEFQKRLKIELAKFEPYWTKVIAIYATN